MKLRTKIILFSILIAVITIAPMMAYVGHLSGKTLIMEKKENSSLMVNIVYHALESQYSNSLNQQLINVFFIKNSLKEVSASLLILKNRNLKTGSSDAKIREFLQSNQEVLTPQNIFLLTYFDSRIWGTAEAMSLASATTMNQTNVEYLLTGDSPPGGTFNIAKTGNSTYLTYVFSSMIDNRKMNFALMKNIGTMAGSHDQVDQEIEIFVSELFESLPMDTVLPLYLLDSDFQVISSNNPAIREGQIFPRSKDMILEAKEEILSNTLNRTNKSTCTVLGAEFICYSYFKPLKVYVLSMEPMSQLTAFGRKIFAGMGFIVVVVLLFMTLFSIAYVTRVTRALSSVASTAQEIASADLSDPATLKKISFPKYRANDEVGDLTRAMENMSNSLMSNIGQLVDTTARQNRLEGELGAAFDIQMGILPNKNTVPKSEFYQISAFINPAKEVGGDFYDVFSLNDDLIVLTEGDVSDKGVPAALFMSICVTLLRHVFRHQRDISQAIMEVNNCLSERNPSMMFATLFTAVLNVRTGEFHYVNAGHCLPIIVGQDRIRELEGTSGPAVGVFEGSTYESFTDTLKPGEYLFVYTDGISEAQNSRKEFFGTERIIENLAKGKFNTANSLVYSVLYGILEFREDAAQSDDITMLCFQRQDPQVEKKQAEDDMVTAAPMHDLPAAASGGGVL